MAIDTTLSRAGGLGLCALDQSVNELRWVPLICNQRSDIGRISGTMALSAGILAISPSLPLLVN